jgi:hypothetical protein
VLASSAPKPPPPFPDNELRVGRLVLREGGARGGVKCPATATGGDSLTLLSSTVLVSVPAGVCTRV